MLLAAALALTVLGFVGDGAGRVPAWSRWWCSPTAHGAHGGSRAGGSLLAALEVHWPHFLPILLGLATLAYLWRASARYAPPRRIGE